MAMYNLIEYNDNYSNTSGSLRQFKRNEVPDNNAILSIDDIGIFNSQSCRSSFCRENISYW